jgi:hypothetical protein
MYLKSAFAFFCMCLTFFYYMLAKFKSFYIPLHKVYAHFDECAVQKTSFLNLKLLF